MTTQELEARAIARAQSLHTHVLAVAGRPGVYTVTSESEPGVKHILVSRDGIDGCDCKGFYFRKSCRHIEALRSRLARETRRPAPAPRPSTSDLYA